MIIKDEGDIVVLVRMGPYGKVEDQFMKDYREIKERIKIKEAAVQLYDVFGWVTSDGKPYTQYELDFETEDDLIAAYDWLQDYFIKIILNDLDDEMTPKVYMAKRKRN